jgi:enhancer of mRNA-decapping protein 3
MHLHVAVFFPSSGHRLPSYTVEGHMIADIKVNASAPTPSQPQPPSEPPTYAQYSQGHVQDVRANTAQQMPHLVSQPSSISHADQSMNTRNGLRQSISQPAQAAPFVDPAILSMGKRTTTMHSSNQVSTAPPQEAPATPMKPVVGASAAPLPKNISSSVDHVKQQNIRKPSAATLEGPFSSLDIADAEEADNETKIARIAPRRASINKTRTGKPMDDASPQKNDDGGKKTRRGGKSRKKEVAAQERKNGSDIHSAGGIKKGYV